MKQLHDRGCFNPIHKSKIIAMEKKKMLESLIFFIEKKDGTIKARHCANGSTQCYKLKHGETMHFIQ